LFDPIGVRRLGQDQALGDPFDMRIDHHRRLSIGVPQDDVRRFPPDPGQGDKFVHGGWNPTMEALNESDRAGYQVFGFALKKSC
jgi:hypothetical protein